MHGALSRCRRQCGAGSRGWVQPSAIRGVDPPYRAVVDHQGPVAQPLHVTHVVRGEQQGGAVPAALADQELPPVQVRDVSPVPQVPGFVAFYGAGTAAAKRSSAA